MTNRSERTPTRTAFEKYTDDEIIAIYGVNGWIDCVLKAQEPHDSSRHRRKLENDAKSQRKRHQKQ